LTYSLLLVRLLYTILPSLINFSTASVRFPAPDSAYISAVAVLLLSALHLADGDLLSLSSSAAYDLLSRATSTPLTTITSASTVIESSVCEDSLVEPVGTSDDEEDDALELEELVVFLWNKL